MATYVGQVSVLSLIALFGAATTAMITTARKAVTLLLSYMIFTKPLTEQHGTGLMLIAAGIMLKMVPENQFSKHAKSIKDAVLMMSPKANEIGLEVDEEVNKPLV
ncbi:hypothetical protein ACLB2K_042851 [Fragaria x ananassa]